MTPTPDEVRAIRRSLGLSSAQCARIVGLAHGSAWQRYEQDGPSARAISPMAWSLFRLRVEQIPQLLEDIAALVGDPDLRETLLDGARMARQGASMGLVSLLFAAVLEDA